MIYKIAFLGKFDEIHPLVEEVRAHLNRLKDDFKTITDDDFEIIGSTSKLKTIFFDLRQINYCKETIKDSKIIVLYLSFSNADSFNIINEDWASDLKNLIKDNQCRLLVAHTTNDFNTNEFSQNIINLMNTLNFDKYFEKRGDNFLTQEQQINSLTILPNFCQYLSDQIKIIENPTPKVQLEENLRYNEGPINYILFPKTQTAKVTKSPNCTGQILIKTRVTHDSKSYIVTEIGDKSFQDTNIESVSFEQDSQVKRIGKIAFLNSTIKSLSIPDSLEEFEENWCNSIDQLTEIKINENHPFFKYKDGLLIRKDSNEIIFAQRDIEGQPNIPKDVKKIGPSSFYNCNKITSLLIESPSIECIDALAFLQCDKLVDISISGTTKLTIGENCFISCTSLQKVNISCDELIIKKNCFQLCSSLSSLSFPVKKIFIGPMAMLGCNKLSIISIHEAISIEIKEQSFLSLSQLKKLFFKADHFSVCNNSFEKCTSVTDIYLKVKDDLNSDFLKQFASLKIVSLTSFSTLTITKSSLANIANLETIIIGSKNLVLEKGCFQNLSKLSTITIMCENPISFSSDDFEGCKALKSFKCSMSKDFNKSEKVDLSENCLSNSANLEEVEIVATNVSIGKSCFNGLKKLDMLYFNCKNMVIGDSAFSNCDSIKSFIMKECTDKIELAEKCFFNASNLEEVEIKSKKINFGYQCFNGAEKLQNVTLNGFQVSISDNCFNNCSSLKSFRIIDSRTTSIGSKQFTKCSNLNSISISMSKYNPVIDKESLVLASDCFEGANNLESLEFIGGNVALSNDMLNCPSIKKLSIKTDKNVEINSNMFNNYKKLDDVEISSMSLKIYENCFNNNPNLKKVSFTCFTIEIQSNCFNDIMICESIQFNNVLYMYFDSNDFCDCIFPTEIQLKSTACLVVGQNCFTKVKKLEKVELNSKEVTIGSGAFNKCSSLKTVHFIQSASTLPINGIAASLTHNISIIEKVFIGDETFNSCNKLSELNIDCSSDLFIGKNCFYNLSNLKSVRINCPHSNIDSSSFIKCPLYTNNTIQIPKKSTDGENFDLKLNLNPKRTNTGDHPNLEKEKFDSFFVIGIDDKTKKPSFISKFPSNSRLFEDNEISQVLEFCYPYGPKHIPSELPNESNILDGFVFYFFGKDKVYGVVIQFYIPITANSCVGNQYDRSYPFSLCLLSNNPDISSHFQFLSELVDPIVGKTIIPDTIYMIPNEFKNLQGLSIRFLYQQFVALSKCSMSFLYPQLLKYYTDKIPLTLEHSDCLLYPTLQSLITFLSPKDIVNIILCILCEFKILFISRDVSKTSFCIIALINLMKDVEIHSLLFPCLPLVLDTNIDSPLPTLIGYHEARKAEVIVDLDQKKITYPDRKSFSAISDFPYTETLITKTKKLFDEKVNQFIIPQKADFKKYSEFIKQAHKNIYPPCFQYFVKTNYILSPDFIREFSQLITKPFVPSLKIFTKSHIITDITDINNPVAIFDKGSFLFHVDLKYKQFMVAFTNTQTFEQFTLKIEKEVENSKKNPREIRRRSHMQNKMQIIKIIKKISQQKRRKSCQLNSKKLQSLD
ncbi:hypothetical protein M9Y10_015472 [Tritrichomonas musculus]|uniref:UDENN domain-containing protein n=1 Tax=Tritrichomonas musculus TaxID=1915356 RepID=A0ABR2L3C2_9EUKA